MLAWWEGLSLTSQIFAIIAIPATVVMIAQSLLLLFGVGMEGDTDGDGVPDADGDGFSLISVRGIVAFFSVGGWVGVVCDSAGAHVAITVLISVAAGLLALIAIAVLFRSAMKLQDSGNLDIINAVGKTGKVYIPIPPKGKGTGKISVLVQNRLVELEAINRDDMLLATDARVVIVSAIDAQTVVVTAAE